MLDGPTRAVRPTRDTISRARAASRPLRVRDTFRCRMKPTAKEFEKRFADLGSYLEPEEIEVLLTQLTPRQFPIGEVVLNEGDNADTAYLVWDGSLVVTVGSGAEASEVGRCGPGALLGEISFIDGGPATATVSAAENTRALCITALALDELRRSHPRIATSVLRAMCRQLAKRVRAVTDRLENAQPGDVRKSGGFLDAFRTLFGIS